MPEQRKTPDGGSYTIYSKPEYDALIAQRPNFTRKFIEKPADMGPPKEYLLRASPFVSADAWDEYRTGPPLPSSSDPDFDLIYTRLAGPVTSGEVDAAGTWKGNFATQREAATAANSKLAKDRSLFRGVITTETAGKAIKEGADRQAFTNIDIGLRSMGFALVYYRFASKQKQVLAEGDPIFVAFDGGHGDVLDEYHSGRRLPFRWESFDTLILSPWHAVAKLFQRQQRDGIQITAAANVDPIFG